MSHNAIKILEGAFVVSDAHYSYLRPQLLDFIKDIHSKKLKATQLIFMGDIFDALFGGIPYTQENNKEIITLIQEITEFLEVIYLEGNHDFNLQAIFKNMKIIPISQQPVLCTYENKKIYLAHGDFDGGFGYLLYTKFIRNRVILQILRLFDSVSNHSILKNVDKHLGKKEDCSKFKGFEGFVSKRLQKSYDCEYFIEGHFHQNRSFDIGDFRYINLAAFACNQRYFIVKSSQDKELLEELFFLKGYKYE